MIATSTPTAISHLFCKSLDYRCKPISIPMSGYHELIETVKIDLNNHKNANIAIFMVMLPKALKHKDIIITCASHNIKHNIYANGLVQFTIEDLHCGKNKNSVIFNYQIKYSGSQADMHEKKSFLYFISR